MLAMDAILADLSEDWFVGQVTHLVRRTLKHLETSARSIFALVDQDTCFAGTLFELALAADRIYMLDDPDAGPLFCSYLSDPVGDGFPPYEEAMAEWTTPAPEGGYHYNAMRIDPP